MMPEPEPEPVPRQERNSEPAPETMVLAPETPRRTGSSSPESGGWRTLSPTQHSPNVVSIEAADDADFIELTAFLAHHGLMRWRPLFIEHEITFDSLLHFEERDLMELGLARGPQVAIIRTMKRWRHSEAHLGSLTVDGPRGSFAPTAPAEQAEFVVSGSALSPTAPTTAEQAAVKESERVEAEAQKQAAQLREQMQAHNASEAMRRQEETAEARRYVQEKAQQYNASIITADRPRPSSGISSTSVLLGPIPTSAEVRKLIVGSSQSSTQTVASTPSSLAGMMDERLISLPRSSSTTLHLVSPTREVVGDPMMRDGPSSATAPAKYQVKALPAAATQARSVASASPSARDPTLFRRSSPLRNRRSPLRKNVSPPRREIATRPHIPRLSSSSGGTARLGTRSRPISHSVAAASGSGLGETPRRIFGTGGMLTSTTAAKQPWSTSTLSPRLGNSNAPGTRIAAMAASARAKPGVSGGARASVRTRSPVRLANGTSSSVSGLARFGSSSTSRR